MEVDGGPMLHAVFRQLSLAAAIRTVPTPCRAQGSRAMRRQVVPAWQDGWGDVALEAWDLDDGFALPPPLLELPISEIGSGQDLADEFIHTPGTGPSGFQERQSPQQQMLQRILMESLGSHTDNPSLCAAVLAGGRRFPRARPVPRNLAAAPGGGRWMRFRQQRQGPLSRQGSTRVARSR